MNPIASINGKAFVLSADTFARDYPTGKIPRNSPGYNKTFVCRRGCNTRTATYTPEFVWEDIYQGREEDIADLVEFVKKGTQSTRRRPKRDEDPTTDSAYIAGRHDPDDDGNFSDDATRKVAVTPRKKQKTARIVTPSSRRYVQNFASIEDITFVLALCTNQKTRS